MTSAAPDMPGTLPVFPLAGVLLLPHGQLPLNVFETRYVAMIDDALRGDRIIGMIQPRLNNSDLTELYETGCAGRIRSFSETDDGRYLITLAGLSRFRVVEELSQVSGYRRVRPDWSPYKDDFNLHECLDLDRGQLRQMLEGYFDMHDLSCDWEAIDSASDARLITCLSMICPFDPGEKQALLEATCCKARAEKFLALLRMALHGDCRPGCHH